MTLEFFFLVIAIALLVDAHWRDESGGGGGGVARVSHDWTTSCTSTSDDCAAGPHHTITRGGRWG